MTEQMAETSNVPEAEPDTYHDQKALMRLAQIAEWISWLFFVIFVVCGVIIGYFAYYVIHNHLAIEQFAFALPPFLVPFLLGGFIWIVLMLASEATYVLMDIEDNTRRPQPPKIE
jgi:H+/Cl- antiporter ClcA